MTPAGDGAGLRGRSAELVERSDLDELTRHVDRLGEAGDWDGLVDLRDRCRRALERGKQLWAVASNAEYRLALSAPGRWAAAVLEPGTGRFALGPLPEVAASRHRWAELAPFAPAGPVAALAAHEAVARGEDLRDDVAAAALPPVLDLPIALAPWEPAYALAEYHEDRADFPAPPSPPLLPSALPAVPPALVADDEACRALVELAGAWTTESNGRAEAVAVEGRAPGALGALGLRRVRLAEVAPADALALMAWTGASGGAHGRRRGAAAGRFAAWWAAAAVAGLDWPVAPDELGEALGALRWYRWDAGEPETGWSCRLAVEDPAEGLAWALAAVDAA